LEGVLSLPLKDAVITYEYVVCGTSEGSLSVYVNAVMPFLIRV